ncbi:MAG: transporter [Thalassotalea sp.]
MSYFNNTVVAAALAGTFSAATFANDDHNTVTPQTHAPIGVMTDHMHNAGEFMFSYRYMAMQMEGNQQGQNDISDQTLVTTIANKFAGMENMPPTLRIAPQTMDMKMHMLGMMYAPNDDITLMVMLNYLDNAMDLTTFNGMMGTEIKGHFTTQSSGLADSKIGILYRLHDDETHHIHLNVNWQIPTGEIEKQDEILTPMTMNNMSTMRMRLPYAMQLGSGSNILELGSTYNGYGAKNNWGLQFLYSTALEDNDENYQVGDKLLLTAWYGHQLNNWLSSSMRLSYTDKDDIDGIDSNIIGPVQSANPAFYGGSYLDFAFGLNTVLANKHRFALEYQQPIKHDVNGVQMKIDQALTFGYQIAF